MWKIALILSLLSTRATKGTESSPRDLAELSIEELMDVRVELVSRKPERLWDAAAAIFVITEEDIKRSGARSLPEALRMVPGMYVAQIDANTWVVTARGFAGRFANKLLVQIDGRTIYTPLFSGVFWHLHDIVIEDVDRIEVIRGPGATLWGANAVNGIINIVTKHARDTRGSLVGVGVGTEERNFGTFRYGEKLGKQAFYRVYAKFAQHSNFADTSGGSAHDGWQTQRGGFRIDWDRSDQDELMVEGELHSTERGERQSLVYVVNNTLSDRTVNTTGYFSGGHALGRWKHFLSGTSDMVLQVYLDRLNITDPLLRETLTTFDIDFQHRFAFGERHEIVWGLGYRYPKEALDSLFVSWDRPLTRTIRLYSAFVQDEFAVVHNRFYLTGGSKFERNDYTGWEIQPNLRGVWLPRRGWTVWAAVSRAVRTPSRAERAGHLVHSFLPAQEVDPKAPPGSPPVLFTYGGDPRFVSEVLVAYELGMRAGVTKALSFDAATFYNVYSNVRTGEVGDASLETDPEPPHLVVPVRTLNKSDGIAYGAEVTADWQIRPWWRTRTTYSHLSIDMRAHEDTKDLYVETQERDTPRNYVHVRSSFDVGRNVNADVMVSWVDDAPAREAKAQFTLNVRIGWRPMRNLEVSLVGQRLIDSPRIEYGGELLRTVPTRAEPSVYSAIAWRF